MIPLLVAGPCLISKSGSSTAGRQHSKDNTARRVELASSCAPASQSGQGPGTKQTFAETQQRLMVPTTQ